MDASLAFVVICLALLVVICVSCLVISILIYINLRSEKTGNSKTAMSHKPESNMNPSGVVFCRACGKQYSSAEKVCPICHSQR